LCRYKQDSGYENKLLPIMTTVVMGIVLSSIFAGAIDTFMHAKPPPPGPSPPQPMPNPDTPGPAGAPGLAPGPGGWDWVQYESVSEGNTKASVLHTLEA
jgi:hypothetical protein